MKERFRRVDVYRLRLRLRRLERSFETNDRLILGGWRYKTDISTGCHPKAGPRAVHIATANTLVNHARFEQLHERLEILVFTSAKVPLEIDRKLNVTAAADGPRRLLRVNSRNVLPETSQPARFEGRH